jgi:hypothetical protein
MDPMAVFLHTLEGTTQLAQALRSAADQQRQFDEEMRLRKAGQQRQQGQDQFSNTMALYRAGARPATATGATRENMSIPAPDYANMPRWTPTAEGKMDLSQAASGMRMVPAVGEVPVADQTRVVAPPGSEQRFYIPTEQEELQRRVREAQQIGEATGFLLPDNLAKRFGMAPGTRLPLEHAAGLARMLDVTAQPEPAKPEKQPNPHIISSTNVRGDVTTTAYHPRSGERLWSKTEKGVGTEHRDPNAPSAPKSPNTRDIDAFKKQHDTLQMQEQHEHGLRWAYGQALGVGKDQPAVDPKTGKRVMMTDERRKYFKTKYDEATKLVQGLQQRQREIRQRIGAGEFASGAGGEQAVAAGAGNPYR